VIPPRARRARAADFLALTKPRIVALVVLTVAAGYVLARPAVVSVGPSTAVWLAVLFHTLLGTALVAGGTNALNQVAERDVDALMHRTRSRPLPAGRLTPLAATLFAWAIALLGLAELAAFVNAATAILAAATLVSYVYVYTPLKRRTTVATLVGAVPGALPIVGGWAAAGAPLDIRAGTLFGLMFLWQIPHFLAIAWMYREDYARAGLKMLSVGDEDGGATFRQATLNAAALLPVGLVPFVLGMAGAVYFAAPTFETVAEIQRDSGIEAAPHLSCIGSTKNSIREILAQLERYYREMIPQQKLMRQLVAGHHVSDAELWRNFRDRTETATVEYVALDVARVLSALEEFRGVTMGWDKIARQGSIRPANI
jgi:heme o synthase